MKYGISSLLGPGLAGALLLGSGCMLLPDDSTGEDSDDLTDGAGFPRVAARLSHGNGTCLLSAGQTDVLCSVPVKAGDIIQASIDVEWGELSAGVIAVVPSCTRGLVDAVDDEYAYQEAWRSPLLNEMDCAVTIDASSQEGPFGSVTMYFSVVDGQPPGEVYGAINLQHTGGLCVLDTGAFSADCGPVRAGERMLVHVEMDWGKHAAGSITVSDTCNGSFATTFSNAESQQLEWVTPAAPGTCTLQAEATTAGGERHVFELNVPVE